MAEDKEKNITQPGEQSNHLNDPSVSYASQSKTSLQKSIELENVGRYWDMLSEKKKVLILDIIKAFAEDDISVAVSEDYWQTMMTERDNLLSGKTGSYSLEEATEILSDPTKRNALRNKD